MARQAWVWGAAVVTLACTSPSREELLEGKGCGPDQRCAAGYVCRDDDVCVRESELHQGTGGALGSGGGPATGGADASGGVEAPGGADSGGGSGGTAGADSGGGSGGTAGADSGGAATGCAVQDCAAIAATLRHRYRFEGAATLVLDWAGTANGAAAGSAVHADGEMVLSDGAYVDLPNGIVSSLEDATFETWVVWNGGGEGQRIFDFGDAVSGGFCDPPGYSAPEGEPGVCTRTSIMLTPSTAAAGLGVGGLQVSVRTLERVGLYSTPTIVRIDATMASPLPVGSVQHIAAVVDDGSDQLRLYLNGERVDATAFTGHLADVTDVNNWLGQSQNAGHPPFDGRLLELRIYESALNDEQIALTFAEGPDAEFLD